MEDDKPSASLSAVPPVCSMEREASAALVVTVLTPATVSSTRFRWAEAGASQGGNSPPPFLGSAKARGPKRLWADKAGWMSSPPPWWGSSGGNKRM